MNAQILAYLVQDGLLNGAIYALLAVAILMVFTITRVIFVPQGDFVTYGALTLASLQAGRTPGSLWLLLLLTLLAAGLETAALMRTRSMRRWPARVLPSIAIAALAWALASFGHASAWPYALQVVFAVLIVAAMGPLLWRVVYQPMQDAPVLVLLVASVALHFAMTGLALLFFGAEGFRVPALTDASIDTPWLPIQGQTLVIVLLTVLMMMALALFFGRTLAGKALRATACNRGGARLIGFSPDRAGALAFTMAAAIGAVSGVLIGAAVTLYYDSGFLIGLKGFVAAVFGGLASYPLTVLGAFGVGLLESMSAFWASSYKEVIVFLGMIPLLMLLSLRGTHDEDEHGG